MINVFCALCWLEKKYIILQDTKTNAKYGYLKSDKLEKIVINDYCFKTRVG